MFNTDSRYKMLQDNCVEDIHKYAYIYAYTYEYINIYICTYTKTYIEK